MLENVGCVRLNKKDGSMSVEKGLWCELKQSSSKGTSIEQGASCEAKSDGNTLANVRKNNFFRVLVVGDLVTGKSSIIKQYVDNFFTPRYRHSVSLCHGVHDEWVWSPFVISTKKTLYFKLMFLPIHVMCAFIHELAVLPWKP